MAFLLALLRDRPLLHGLLAEFCDHVRLLLKTPRQLVILNHDLKLVLAQIHQAGIGLAPGLISISRIQTTSGQQSIPGGRAAKFGTWALFCSLQVW